MMDEDFDYDEDFDAYEPDLDFGYEFDSAMESVGWGTDEDYGLIGGDSDLWGEF